MKIFTGRVTIQNFNMFENSIKEIFEFIYKTVPHTSGKNASYIPALAAVNPDLFAISICTIDGQKLNIGQHDVKFCLQSTSKIIS